MYVHEKDAGGAINTVYFCDRNDTLFLWLFGVGVFFFARTFGGWRRVFFLAVLLFRRSWPSPDSYCRRR